MRSIDTRQPLLTNTFNTEFAPSPRMAKRPQPSSPGLKMAAWSVREYTRLVASPATPAEVAQRSRILHTVGAVAAALVGCVLVCTAIAFPPAAIAGGVLGAAAFMAAIAITRHGFVVQKQLQAAELQRQARARAMVPPQMDDETLANIEQVDEMLVAEGIRDIQALSVAEEAESAEDAVRQVEQYINANSEAPTGPLGDGGKANIFSRQGSLESTTESTPLLARVDSNASFISSLSRQSSTASTASFHSSTDSVTSDISHISDITDESDLIEHLELPRSLSLLADRVPNMAALQRVAEKYDITLRILGPTEDGMRHLGDVGTPEDPESFTVHLWMDDHGFRAISKGVAVGEPTGVEGAAINAMVQSNKVPPQNHQAIVDILKKEIAFHGAQFVASSAA